MTDRTEQLRAALQEIDDQIFALKVALQALQREHDEKTAQYEIVREELRLQGLGR
jgi:hypothetical protein